MHINKPDDSKYKESSEESSLPRLRGRLLQSCRAHCLSSKAQTCCGQPVLPLVFLSLLLTVLFKISFWGDRMRRKRKREREQKKKKGRGRGEKKVRDIPPRSRPPLRCPERETNEETRASAEACRDKAGRPPRGLAAGEASAVPGGGRAPLRAGAAALPGPDAGAQSTGSGAGG